MVVKTKKRALKTKKNMKGGWRISKIYTRTSSSKFHGVEKLSSNQKTQIHEHIKRKTQNITNSKAKHDYRNLKSKIYAQLEASKKKKILEIKKLKNKLFLKYYHKNKNKK